MIDIRHPEEYRIIFKKLLGIVQLGPTVHIFSTFW